MSEGECTEHGYEKKIQINIYLYKGCVCAGDAKLEAKSAQRLGTVTVIMQGHSSLVEKDHVSACHAPVCAFVCMRMCMHVCVLLVKRLVNLTKKFYTFLYNNDVCDLIWSPCLLIFVKCFTTVSCICLHII